MKERVSTNVHRRDLFRIVVAGAVAAVTTVGIEAAAGELNGKDNKRRPRYRADSVEVQNFYRVNRYPTT
ncbi:hypothetical protein [Mesorhizobium sp. LNHC209A00]|uniref:hypothetical protein n=1 Tax=Mesorhizobium TaxID=68287 RepID=UPI0003CFF88C|nr:hypothetical protein [Mesorhizobium sp. LNHC209A00]ESY94369.1 hypothetical protein X738_24665 [Mesorhizobium sp. LNHC209A00]